MTSRNLSFLTVLLAFAGAAGAQCSQWNASFPGLEDPVLAVTTWDPDGAGPLPPVLVASGASHIVGTDPYHNIAYWDASTSTWQPLGSGMQGPGPSIGQVRSLIVYNGDLIAAGSFSTAGGVAADSIARWSGTLTGGSWQPLGSGIAPGGNGVDSMAVYGTQLMVGGNFGGAGGLTLLGGVALWDGASWSRMNSGFNQSPSSVCVYNGRAYAAGSFGGTNDGVALNGIGSWASPGPWQSPGSGLPYVGLSMAVYNNELIVGGYPGVNCTMRWNGSSWGNLGAGVAGYVLALRVYDDGTGPNLIAAGSFTTAGGAPANRIARWNGSTWQPLANGLPSDVNAVTVYNGLLVAAGNFSTVNGVPYNYIATWGCPPPTCGSADFNCDGDIGTDADIESFFACLAGNCPAAPCTSSADFNHDGDIGTDADIESFFRVLAGGPC